jgi:FixJ family two-component response regulator
VEWNVTVARDVVVWLVDDVASVRKSIRAVLETADFTVRDFASAKEFLADFRPGSPGCLVVDQHMPDMSGIELLQHLSERGITPPAIVITGQGDSALRAKAMHAGAIAMLDKPVDGVELIELIEATLAAA